MRSRISLYGFCGENASNKDVAKVIREQFVKKCIKKNEKLVIDFDKIELTTQSFIHALISEVFQEQGEKTLDLLEFKNCSKDIRAIIGNVINYSLEE